MARKKNPLTLYEPTPAQQMDYAMEHAIEKAVLNHPQTQKLRKTIATEMKKAAKTTPKKK